MHVDKENPYLKVKYKWRSIVAKRCASSKCFQKREMIVFGLEQYLDFDGNILEQL